MAALVFFLRLQWSASRGKMALSSSTDDCAAGHIPLSNGCGHFQDEPKVRLTLNLVSAARRHLAFLKSLCSSTFLHHSPTILRAIRRYDELWMPLISRLSEGLPTAPMLLPPPDVRWVWHCHCLNPASYRHYCTSRFGRLVEQPTIFDQENEEYASNLCGDIWASEFPLEPFDLETVQGVEEEAESCADCSGQSIISYLFAAVAKYRTLYSFFSDPFVAETVYLVSARQRYIGFLHLCWNSADGRGRMVPTSDILLMWLTHQSFPGVYVRDLKDIMGSYNLAQKVVGFGEHARTEELEETIRKWEGAFGEPYERAGSSLQTQASSSRLLFYWEEPRPAAASESNRKYRSLQPRSIMEVCVFLKGQLEEMEAKDSRKMFVRLRTMRCHKEMKLDKDISGLSSVLWQRRWHLFCGLGTRGLIVELRKQGSNCLGNSKLINYVVFMWNDLLRTPSLTLTEDLSMHGKALISVTPPVQAPYLLKCVPDRVTDDKGAMISDVILRMNNYHPQEGRWLSRTVLDHSERECFVIRIRLGDGFWRRGAETPRAVDWKERIIEVREGPWSYIANSVGTAPSKIVGTAVPKEKDMIGKKMIWSLSTGHMLIVQWQSGLEFQIENDDDSSEMAKLVPGRKLQFQVKDACLENENHKQDEEQFVTLIRFARENFEGRATALLNWNLLAVEFLPEEDAVFVLLLCIVVVRAISEIKGEDRGQLRVRRRVKEATIGIKDWGTVMLAPGDPSLTPRLKPWFWNPMEVFASAKMIDSTSMYKNSPADGKDELYRQAVMPSR